MWQAIHLNVPPPSEPAYKQILRRVGWSILATIAPEVVALNAWLQYREASDLVRMVNLYRKMPKDNSTQHWLKRLSGNLGMLCISIPLLVDRMRMLLRHHAELRAFECEQQQLRNDSLLSKLENDELPWILDTAFYALSGGAVMLSNQRQLLTMESNVIEFLAEHDPKSLLPLQQMVLQDPSKANGLAKFITCVQAFWFCSQCIARLSQNMAISLLELNTFAHCISALIIYVFWWHKPYDAATHVVIDLSQAVRKARADRLTPWWLGDYLGDYTDDRSKNMHRHMFSRYGWVTAGFLRPLIIILTFLIYGAMHSLAWQYNFPTEAEGTIWRCASIATASSGLIVVFTIVRGSDWALDNSHLDTPLHLVVYLLGFVAIVARSFLVIESFRALPNSPASIYEIPRWTAYIPHI